jgi:hypothetical protein
MIGRRCTMVKSSGERCGARPLRDGQLCFHHDPEHADAAADARKLGGHRRRREETLNAAYELGEIDSLDGQRRLLEIVVTDALALDNGVPKLRVILAALNTAMKLRDATEVEARLAALEAARHHGLGRQGQATSDKEGRSER